MRVLAFVRRFDPDGEELRVEISGPRFIKADVAEILWVRVADVKAFINETLWRVGMRVDDQGRVVNLKSLRRYRSRCRILGNGCDNQGKKQSGQREGSNHRCENVQRLIEF